MNNNSKNKKPRILTVGSMNMDLVLNMNMFPEKNETVFGSDYRYVEGGKGGNQAVAAARLGANSMICGSVGDDANGSILIERLAAAGVGTKHVRRTKEAPTGLAVIPVDKDGNNEIMVFPSANMTLDMDAVTKALDDGCYDAILLQLEIPAESVRGCIQEAKKRNIPTILDAAPASDQNLEFFRGVDIVSPNESECKAWTGIYPMDESSMIEAAEILRNKTGAWAVVLKLGSRGCALYTSDGLELFPAFAGIQAIDSTAAGDTFTAALAVRWCECSDLRLAIPFANAAGALCVSRSGAQPSIPTKAETDSFLEARNLRL